MKIPSQVYAVVFLILGIVLLVIADHAHSADVIRAMITAGSGLIMGAATAYQNDQKPADPKPDKPQPPTAPKEGA